MQNNQVQEIGNSFAETSQVVPEVTQGTTTFTSTDKVERVVSKQMPIPTCDELMTSAKTMAMQDIQDFLAKPIYIGSGTFATTDVTTGLGTKFDIYRSYLTNDLIYNKIKGNLGIAGKLVVRVVINGERFQQGLYALGYMPLGGSSSNQNNLFIKSHMAHLTLRSQLPKAMIDVNRDTSVAFHVPYASSQPMIPIYTSPTATNIYPGLFYMFAYAPLVSPTGSTTCTYTIYAHMEDVRLYGPTVPQGNLRKRSSGANGSDHQATEQDGAGVGPISSALANVSAAANIVSEIPLLSPIAEPVSWFADIASRVAHVFGWSNPLDLAEVTRAVQTIFPYANNCDVLDASMPLTLFARNKLEVTNTIAGTDIDEMSIDFLKSIPAYYTTYTISTSDVAYTAIANLDFGYRTFVNTITDGPNTGKCYVPFSYLASMFHYVRGGVVFTFRFVTTEFHSGRYEVVFAPYDDRFAAAPTITNVNDTYCHRMIMDLRDGNEFTFSVPYSSILMYKDPNTNKNLGRLSFIPINPLVAPSSVSTSCSVIVEVSGAPDMEFAGIEEFDVTVYSPNTPQANLKTPKHDSQNYGGSLGGSSLFDENHMPARLCIGEKVLSILSVLKHNGIIGTSAGGNLLSTRILPWGTFNGSYNGTTTSHTSYGSDQFTNLASMYALIRGGMRWRIVPPASGTDVETIAFLSWETGNADTIRESAGLLIVPKNSLLVRQNVSFRGGVEVQTPPYNNTHAIPVASLWDDTSNTANLGDPTTNQQVLYVNYPTSGSITFSRQVADDFQAMCFVSVPCVTTSF